MPEIRQNKTTNYYYLLKLSLNLNAGDREFEPRSVNRLRKLFSLSENVYLYVFQMYVQNECHRTRFSRNILTIELKFVEIKYLKLNRK